MIDDHGRVVTGLKRDWFSIVEKRSQLPLTSFETSAEPASVAILFDLSYSVLLEKKDSIRVVTTFIKAANPNSEYLVVGFNKDVNVIADRGQNLGYIEKGLSDASDASQRPARDSTALYDACDPALTKLASRRNLLHVLLVVSDGQENASKLSFVKLREQLKQTSAIAYAIGLSEMSRSSALSMEGQGILDELTSVSGGSAYYPMTDKATLAAVDHISFELSNQYRIRFKPAAIDPDGKWHPIKIKLTLPETDDQGHKFGHLYVRSREGYYDR